jgi:RNA-binding protein
VEIKGFQKSFLKRRAHELKPVVQVGQSGVTDTVVEQVEVQLLAHELIKVRMREPEDKKAMARELADRTGAALCALVGHTAILYRPHPEAPVIVLPER